MSSVAKSKFSLERHFRVYNDSTGEYIEIRPDADGLDLVELNGFASDGKKTSSLTIEPAAAVLLADALTLLANRLLPSADPGDPK